MDMKLTYGTFSHEFGGDMPGEDPDIESIVGPEVGHVDVCTVHHHGSKYSSNDDWLNDLTPAVCILSVGDNSYGHPTADALDRLHAHGVQVCWRRRFARADGPRVRRRNHHHGQLAWQLRRQLRLTTLPPPIY